MLPHEVVVQRVEVPLPCPALVVEYDDFLLRALPIVGKDAAVDVLLAEEILHLRFVLHLGALDDEPVVSVFEEL